MVGKITIFEPHLEDIKIGRPGNSEDRGEPEGDASGEGRRLRWLLAPIAIAALGAVGYALIRVRDAEGETIEIDEVEEVEA